MEETLLTFHRVLSLAGIPIFKHDSWNSTPWFLLQIFHFINGILCFVFTTGFVVTNFSNKLMFIQGACIWSTGLIMTISLGVCLIFRKNFRNFLNEMIFRDNIKDMPLISFVLTVDGGTKVSELQNLVEESQTKLLKYTRLLLKGYVASVWLCATLYLCMPIYVMAQKKDSSLRLLAFDMWFPWSLNNFGVYVASFIYHAYCGYLCCIAYPGIQSTIVLLVGQIIRQLRILAFILLHLDELAKEIIEDEPGRWQECCTAVFTQCIEHYITIKRFSNKLNAICRLFYLALILIAIMLVCMCSVKITISDKLCPDTMKYYVHEACFILMVLMFCALGQQVQNECELLEQTVTEKWYLYDRKHKKSVLIFSMAVSQGMPIHIFGSTTLSLPTFTWFIRTVWSFFTMMLTVLEKEN